MRNVDVIKQFVESNHRKCKSVNLRYEGDKLIFFQTTIAQRTPEGKIIYNDTRYSVSTSKILPYSIVSFSLR